MNVVFGSIPNEEGNRNTPGALNTRIRNAFEEFFCLPSNLGNDELINAQRPGLKTGWDFRGLVFKRVWKRKIFALNLIGSGFGEPGGTPLPRFPRSSTPPPPRPLLLVSLNQ